MSERTTGTDRNRQIFNDFADAAYFSGNPPRFTVIFHLATQGETGLQEKSTITLDMHLRVILEETRTEYGMHSLLLADHNGLPVSHAGKIAHTGMSAIAPELIRVGDHAVRLGEYSSITCVALVLEDSHLMVIKDLEIGGDFFVLVMDTASVPKGIRKLLARLRGRIAEGMPAGRGGELIPKKKTKGREILKEVN